VTLPQTVRIREIRDETPTIRTFVLEAEAPEATPGQFIMLWLPGVDEKPMSIACPTPLTVTVARLGPFSTTLHQCKVGSRVGWRGPYGKGFSLRDDHEALLVAGGCGVGPLYFLATQAVGRGVPTTVALGARTADELLYVERFQALTPNLIIATDDGSAGHYGYVTDALPQSAFTKADDRHNSRFAVYACGPEPMLVTLHRLCRERDIFGQLSLERYMKCGFGICGQCALDGFLVCQDGPVFDAEQLDGIRDFGHTRRSATGRQLPM